MWNQGTIPFVIVAVFVATGPVIFMTIHSFRHGHVASLSDEALVPVPANPDDFGCCLGPTCRGSVAAEVARHSGLTDG